MPNPGDLSGQYPELRGELADPVGQQVVQDLDRAYRIEPPARLTWTQDLEESPFERMFREVTTEVTLESEAGGTRVTLALHQRLRGINRLGGFLLRRASGRVLDEALDGLERAYGT